MQKIEECYEADGKPNAAAAEIERALALVKAMDGEEKVQNFSNYTVSFEKELRRIKGE